MKAFALHFSFEFLSGLRNRMLLLLNYLLPLGFYFMMGLMMSEVNPMFVETMVPAMVVFAVLSGMILGLPEPLVAAREAGIFRSYHINGVPATNIVFIPALSVFIHSLIVSLIISLTAPLVFEAPAPVDWLWFSAVFVLLAFAVSGLGTLIGVISATSRGTILWSQLIYLPSMMLSGMMVPSRILPAVLARLGRLLPGTYAMEAFGSLGLGRAAEFSPYWALAILFAGGALAFGLALCLFSWDSHNTRRPSLFLAFLALLPYVLGAIFLPLAERMPLG